MAKKKQRSKGEQRLYDWLGNLQEGGIAHRMLSSWAASTVLQEERPGWFWVCVIALLIVFILPICLYSFTLELLGHAQFAAWENLFYLVGFLSSLFAGIGTANLFMFPLEKLCAHLLRKDFPQRI